MQRAFGVVVFLAGATTATGLGMLASRLAGGEPTTAVRAIVVHGALVRAPVLIADSKIATALHDEVHRAQLHVPRYPKELLTRRPCLTMAAFLPNAGTAETPSRMLRPELADVTWYFYPAVEHEPAVLGRARMSPAQLDAISSFGIPARVARAAGAPCAPQPTAVAAPDNTP